MGATTPSAPATTRVLKDVHRKRLQCSCLYHTIANVVCTLHGKYMPALEKEAFHRSSDLHQYFHLQVCLFFRRSQAVASSPPSEFHGVNSHKSSTTLSFFASPEGLEGNHAGILA